MQRAQSIKPLHCLQITVVIQDLAHSCDYVVIVDLQVKLLWNAKVRCVVDLDSDVLAYHHSSVPWLVTEDRNADQRSFCGDCFGDGTPTAVSHVSSDLRKT